MFGGQFSVKGSQSYQRKRKVKIGHWAVTSKEHMGNEIQRGERSKMRVVRDGETDGQEIAGGSRQTTSLQCWSSKAKVLQSEKGIQHPSW